MLYLSGDRGFRADIPPGMSLPIQQWHAKVRIDGMLASYTIRVRLPDLDDETDEDETGEAQPPGEPARLSRSAPSPAPSCGLRSTTATGSCSRRASRSTSTWKHSGAAAPRSAREAAERIGWQPHTVSKRCENIRNRYVRIGVPGLRGPRALEELAALLISTGELTGDDLRRLPTRPCSQRPAARQGLVPESG